MSRIGKMPIAVPQGVEIKIDPNNLVSVKGPRGHLMQQVDPDIKVALEEGEINVVRPTDQKRHRSLHGLYRSLINNMVEGVSAGFVKELEVVGVGFRASNTGQLLELALGYSHPVLFYVPDEVKVSAGQEKGKNPIIRLESADKELIGQIAAKIRSLRKPEPYKGKGIRFVGEQLRRKAGKAAAKK
ncbi:MAG: 50S ribosomal protein L6 [Lewinellaceae bacterium]|nr:50S ribosomal protein L6 [Saprospiraceae bacterium]MCB9339492.1 50S ribosomal protein L6 [Lewinellaceae bacterium]